MVETTTITGSRFFIKVFLGNADNGYVGNTKENKMYLITPKLIRTKEPCYDPNKYLSETYSANLAEFLTITEIPATDRVWVAINFLNDKDLRLFAVDCATRALARVPNPDQRSLAAIEVARRFALGEATSEE